MFKGLVDVRAKQGYTAYQMNFFLSESGDNGKLDGEYATWNEGGRVWQKDKKWVLPNTGFFSNCDERIQYLAGRGLVSALGFDWGPYAYDDKTVQSFQTAARYIVARYAAYPVCWITCGESRMTPPIGLKLPDTSIKLIRISTRPRCIPGWKHRTGAIKATNTAARIGMTSRCCRPATRAACPPPY